MSYNSLVNPLDVTLLKRSISLDSSGRYIDIEWCNECNTEPILNICNKCGNGVCKNESCHLSFPHQYNTTYIICYGCSSVIENKLINYDHLLIYKFLKQNIRKRRVSC